VGHRHDLNQAPATPSTFRASRRTHRRSHARHLLERRRRTNNIAIAFDTVVEKRGRGSGNDTIRASNVASTLQGGDATTC